MTAHKGYFVWIFLPVLKPVCYNMKKKYNNQLVPAFMRWVLVNNLPDLLDEWHEHKMRRGKN